LFPRNPAWQKTTPPPTSVPQYFTTEDVIKAIRELARGQSAGVSGAAPDHLLAFIDNAVCVEAITNLMSAIANGKLADNVRVYLLRGRLVILKKPSGGLRPITVPEPLMMLAEHLCLSKCKSELPEILEPMQLGVGAKAGVEKAKHRMQHVIDSGSRSRQTVVVLIDITNAYGTISRQAMLQAIYANPKLAPLWQIAYWSMSAPAVRYLRMDDGSIRFLWQEEGGAQGSVIMPAMFAVALQPLLNLAKEASPQTEIAAILDDIAVGGDLDDVMRAYDLLSQQIEQRLGSKVNPKKSIMILGFEGAPTQEIIKACKERSITLNVDGDRYVGAFIGRNKELQEEFVLKQLERHRPVFEALSQPGMSTQIAMILLRTCILPVMTHLYRTMTTDVTRKGAEQFDQLMLDALAKVLNQPNLLGDDDRSKKAVHQLSLPVAAGGMGITPAVLITPSAYIGSIAQCAEELLPFYPGAVERLAEVKAAEMIVVEDEAANAKSKQKKKPASAAPSSSYQPPKEATSSLQALTAAIAEITHHDPNIINNPLDDKTGPLEQDPIKLLVKFAASPHLTVELQSSLHHRVMKVRATQLSNSLSVAGKARLLSAAGPQAGRAFTVIPKWLELVMSNKQFQLAVAHRCDLPYARFLRSRCKKCGIDPNANEHSHGCPALRRTAALASHTAIQNVWKDAVQKNGGFATIEVQITEKKVVDLDMVMHAQRIMADVSNTCPAANTYKADASQKTLNAAHIRELAKNKKYVQLCNRIGARFVPLVMESYGAMTRTVVNLARRIAEYGRDMMVPKALTANDILNRLAVTLQRGNAFLISSSLVNAVAGVT
jgi:hypothetical protein